MLKKFKSKVRTPVFTAMYYLLRPFGRVPVSLNGTRAVFSFRSPDDIARAWGFTGEKEVFGELLRQVAPGDTVWDVGANVGTHAVMFGKAVASQGRVVAFEPESGTRLVLDRNIRLNRLSNVEVRPFALGDVDETGRMFVDSTAGSGKHSLLSSEGYGEIPVQIRMGDNLVEEGLAGVPSIVKIDVEGFELRVLQGMKKTLSKPECRIVMCEVHTEILRELGEAPDAPEAMLRAAGFTQFDRAYRGSELHLTARKV